jgi:hypothetical protein
MSETNDSPMLDDDGKLRMHRFVVATLTSAVVIAVAVAVGIHLAQPDGGWAVAFGVGAMIGFWMCPLAGAVVGNGYHEIMKDRAAAAATAPAATVADDAGSVVARPAAA